MPIGTSISMRNARIAIAISIGAIVELNIGEILELAPGPLGP